MKPLLWFLSLLGLHITIAACNFLPVAVSTQASPQPKSTNFYHNVMFKVSLLSREEKLPPIGIPPQPNRDLGLATVFISIENHQESNQIVTIQNIEIRNIFDNQLQSFDFSPQEIELKPLENSVIDIHLKNKTGYVGQDRVKAIITYQIGKQLNLIESEPVEVERH